MLASVWARIFGCRIFRSLPFVISNPVPDGRRVQVDKLKTHVAAPPITTSPTRRAPLARQSGPARKRTRPQRPDAQMPASRRPRGSSSATPQIPFPDHRSCSAPYPDARSTASRPPGTRAPSLRPRESEGKAEGLDEDDDGEVRSEGSGPQSWALAAPATAASRDLRRSDEGPTQINPETPPKQPPS